MAEGAEKWDGWLVQRLLLMFFSRGDLGLNPLLLLWPHVLCLRPARSVGGPPQPTSGDSLCHSFPILVLGDRDLQKESPFAPFL